MTEWLERLEDKREAAERRRGELLSALREREVADPFSLTIFSIATLKLLAISAAVSIGTALATRALTPRQRFTTGQLQGTLQVPQSDQGLPIVEGYGADPATNAEPFQSSHVYTLEDRVVSGGYFYVVTTAGTSAATAPTFPTTKGASVTSGGVTFTNYGRTGGGFRLPMLVVWTSGLRRHERQVESSGGGKGPQAPEQTEVTYDLDLAVMPGRGPLYVKRIRANTDTIYNVYRGESAYYEAEAGGNTKAGGAATVADALASGGSAVTIPQNGSLQWNNVYGDGSAIRLEFYLKTTAPVTVEFTWTGENGTTVFNASISSTGGVYNLEYGSAPWLLVSGSSNTIKVKNLSATAIVFDKLGVRISGGATGVPDPDIDPDEDYDEGLPPDPTADDREPTRRFSGELDEDNDGVRTGSIQAGGYAGLAIYPGNTTQLPDPTMQAAVDAQYGADSTPAFHNLCLIVLTNFYLTKYGGAIPLVQTLADHQTLDTLETIFEHFCERAGVLEATDYDFSGLRRVFVRGFPVTPPYAPADVMEELARVYNVYFYESDKIYARVRNSQAAVAALTAANLGWVDGDADDEGEELQSLDFQLATQTEIAGRYELTFVDPGRDFDQNTQGTGRSTKASRKTEKFELAVTMFPEEAREFEQRELYEEAVESSKVSLSLDWSYIWLTPGDSFTVTEEDGTVTRIFAESVKPNVGVIAVEGLTEETAVYSQPVSTTGEPFETPPVPIPGQTLVGFWDGPLLTDAENSINNGAGFYSWAVKRRGDGGFTGSALYVDRGLGYELLATFTRQATYGTTATVLTATTSVNEMVADALTVDLYTDDTLESYTEADVWAGAGDCIVGDEVCQILTAVRDTSDLTLYPNRWDLTIALRARRGTDYAVNDHAIGERFVLITDAVQFIPLNVNEANVERDYKMVSSGQSLDDAATVPFVCTFGGLKYPTPIHLTREDDADLNATVEWRPRLRLGHGIHNGLSGFDDREREVYEIDFWTDATRTTVAHSARVEGMVAEDVLTEFVSDYNDLGVATNEREMGTRRIPADDAFLVARLQDVQTSTSTVGLVDANGAGYLVLDDGSRFWSSPWTVVVGVNAATGLTVTTSGGAGFSQGVAYTEDTADVLIEVKQGRLLFYLNRNQGGDAPLFTLSYPTLGTRDLRAYFFRLLGQTAATNRAQGRIQRHYKYWADEQVADFGSTQNPLYVSVYRWDERIGRGYPAEATLYR